MVVPKLNGKVSFCINFTNLNDACLNDSYPLPSIEKLVSQIVDYEMFILMEGYFGYNQIKLAKEDQEKTSFITEDRLYYYKVMLFSLKNAGDTYQRLVDQMFRDIICITVEVYIDDIIIKSQKNEDHLRHLQEVFDKINQYNIKLNARKCVFGVSSVKFFGHMITTRGIEVDPAKIRAVADMPPPKSKNQIQKFNGIITMLNRFISKASDRTRPLIQLLKKGSSYKWMNEYQKAFDKLKDYLQSALVLVSPMLGDILGFYLGITDFTISGVLFK